MSKMKMSDVLSEDSFILSCQLAVNRLAMNVTALMNTEVNSEVFIHLKHQDFMKKRLQIYIKTAQRSVSLKKYNNKHSESISWVFTVNLMIEEQKVKINFIFCDIDRYDLLVKRRWFTKIKTLLNCVNIRLIWSEKSSYQTEKNLIVSWKQAYSLKVNSEHQLNADCRDNLQRINELIHVLKCSEKMNKVKKSQSEVTDTLKKSASQLRTQSVTWKMQQCKDTHKMNDQLQNISTE